MTRTIFAVLAVLACTSACKARDDKARSQQEARTSKTAKPPKPPDPFTADRERMVDRTIAGRGVTDQRVIEAVRSVPRHEYVPAESQHAAYEDRPVSIGFGLNISQPYIVALMTEAVKLRPGDRVLEIGTGSGYQAGVLAELSAEVYTIEIHDQLGKIAQGNFKRLQLDDVHLRIADGYFGWPEAAPFDAIIVTVAAPVVPPPLIEQLAIGGRLVMPVGDYEQELQLITKGPAGTSVEKLSDVNFSPMLGEVRKVR